MKALVASSFHAASTRDVWRKLVRGLEMNGVDVQPYDLTTRVQLFSYLEARIKRNKSNLPDGWTPGTMAYEILLGAAIFHDCEWVVIVSPQYFPTEIAWMMRKVGIKTAAVFTECPYEDTIHTPITSASFDVSFVNDKYSADLFRSFCPVVEYLPHCYDPALHHLGEDEREDNIVFVGTGYGSRMRFLRDVEWPRRLDLYGHYPWQWRRGMRELRDAIRQTEYTTPDQTADLYRKSALSFSLHRTQRYSGSDEEIMRGEAYSVGPRVWELAACGTFQISDYRPELIDVFGDAVPVFETPREFSALTRRAFEEPQWRQELALRQHEAARPYSCDRVIKTVADALAA